MTEGGILGEICPVGFLVPNIVWMLYIYIFLQDLAACWSAHVFSFNAHSKNKEPTDKAVAWATMELWAKLCFFLLSPVGLWVSVRGAVCAATYVAEDLRWKKKRKKLRGMRNGSLPGWDHRFLLFTVSRGPTACRMTKKTATKTTTAKNKTARWCLIITDGFIQSNGIKTVWFFPPATSWYLHEKRKKKKTCLRCYWSPCNVWWWHLFCETQ